MFRLVNTAAKGLSPRGTTKLYVCDELGGWVARISCSWFSSTGHTTRFYGAGRGGSSGGGWGVGVRGGSKALTKCRAHKLLAALDQSQNTCSDGLVNKAFPGFVRRLLSDNSGNCRNFL